MSKRQQMREKHARQQRTQRILIIAGISVIALAVALMLILPTLRPAGTIVEPAKVTRPQAKFNAMGDPNAPVKIVEYSDFQCPYCDRFVKDTEQQIIDAYIATGKVYFVYRSFGDAIGPESGRAAEAAYCAGDQDKFWEMHDIIFANQTGENVGAFSDKRLVAFASKIGLDAGKFSDCFNGGKYASKVLQDRDDGRQAGVQSFPSFIINGKLFEGAQPFAEFQKQIDSQLKQ